MRDSISSAYTVKTTMPSTCLLLLGLLFVPLLYAAKTDDQPKWIRVSSSHFAILTDAGEKKGTQTILRMEQMRTVIGNLLMKSKLHLSEPLDIIAVKSDEEYVQLAPVRDGHPIGTSGFFLDGDDRNYIVLDLADDNSWQTITGDFARMFLNYNYPPTPSWFDEGLAEYFSSIQLTDQQGEMGADPGSFVNQLNTQAWLPLPELFAAHPQTKSGKEQPTKPIFRAQSWIVMHYLISQDKLSETGAYFGMVQMQGTPIEQAIQKAYGVSSAQLEQAIKEHLGSFGTSAATSTTKFGSPGATKFNPVGPLNIGTSYKQVPLPEAQSLIAEMMVRLPEHRASALEEVEKLSNDPKAESSIQYRTQAWVAMQQSKADEATAGFQKAIELNINDPWAHYYFARMKYRAALSSGNTFPGLANMLVNLRTVLDWDADFAEAYNMLAMGRVEGGGTNSAVEVIRKAMELSPRNEMYLLNMGLVNMAAKNWDAATTMLEHLRASPDPAIAADAKSYLDQLPNIKKYGMLPKRAIVQTGPAQPVAPKPKVETDDEDADARPVTPPLDKRKVLFLRGKLLRVDCSSAPSATVSVLSGAKTWRLRAEDYHSLLLLGANEFSCEWTNLSVMVNYKAGGKGDGDLVSLEVRQ